MDGLNRRGHPRRSLWSVAYAGLTDADVRAAVEDGLTPEQIAKLTKG